MDKLSDERLHEHFDKNFNVCFVFVDSPVLNGYHRLDAKTATASGAKTTKTVQADRVTGMSLQVKDSNCSSIEIDVKDCCFLFIQGSKTNSQH